MDKHVCIDGVSREVRRGANELTILPAIETFFMQEGDSLALTCELTGATDDANCDIKWLDNNGQEITAQSGRSVPAASTFSPFCERKCNYRNAWQSSVYSPLGSVAL